MKIEKQRYLLFGSLGTICGFCGYLASVAILEKLHLWDYSPIAIATTLIGLLFGIILARDINKS